MKEAINTTEAPAALGPYSQAVKIVRPGAMLFVSGQVALIPGEKTLDNESIEVETHRVMSNVGAVLRAAGFEYSDIVHSRIFIRSQDLFVPVNKVYAEYFTEDILPARECVVASPPLDDANVEITAMAIRSQEMNGELHYIDGC